MVVESPAKGSWDIRKTKAMQRSEHEDMFFHIFLVWYVCCTEKLSNGIVTKLNYDWNPGLLWRA